MRTFYTVLLLIFLVAVLVFAAQNTRVTSVRFLGWSVSAPAAQMILGVYVLGMMTGATVVALLNRLLRRVTQRTR
jgi:uncharacterized integral membrane protein